MSFTPKNILIVGATGWLGSLIATELLKRKEFTVKILVRKDTRTTKKDLIEKYEQEGGKIVEGDISDPGSLPAALQDVDTVISTVSGPALFQGDQSKLLKAAKEAGVKLLIPSEFGVAVPEGDPMLGGKKAFQKEIIESGLNYTFIVTGCFYQYFFSPAARFDVKEGKISVPGDGNARFSTIDIHDIARYVPEILLDQETRNKTVHLAGATLTYNEAIKIFEDVTGKKFQVTHVSREEDEKTFETNPEVMQKLIARLSLVITSTKQDHPNEGAKYQGVLPTSIKDFATSLL